MQGKTGKRNAGKRGKQQGTQPAGVKCPDTLLYRTVAWYTKIMAENRDVTNAYNALTESHFSAGSHEAGTGDEPMSADLQLLTRLGPYADSLPFICHSMARIKAPEPVSRKHLKRYRERMAAEGEEAMRGHGGLLLMSVILFDNGSWQEAREELLMTAELSPLGRDSLTAAWDYLTTGIPPEGGCEAKAEDAYASFFIAVIESAACMRAANIRNGKIMEGERRKHAKTEKKLAGLEDRLRQAEGLAEKQEAERLRRAESAMEKLAACEKEKDALAFRLERAEKAARQHEGEISRLQAENRFLLNESDALLRTLEDMDAGREEIYAAHDGTPSRITGRVVIAGALEGWRSRISEAFRERGVNAMHAAPGQELDMLKKDDVLVLNIRSYKHRHSIPLRNHCLAHRIPQVITSATNFDMLMLDVRRQLFKEKTG